MLLQVKIFHSVFMADWFPIVCVDMFFIHSSVDRHLGCFHILAIVNSALVNTGMHVFFQSRVFLLSRYTLWSGIAESYGK